MTSAANLLCSLTSGQITGITESVFTSSVSALAKISLTCPNMNSWYAKAKISSTYGATLVSDNSKLTELGSILSMNKLIRKIKWIKLRDKLNSN